MFPAVLECTDRYSAERLVVVGSLTGPKAYRASPLPAGHKVLPREFIDHDTDYVTHLVAVHGAIV